MVIPREYNIGPLTENDLARIAGGALELGLTESGLLDIGSDPRGPAFIFQHTGSVNPACLTIYDDGTVHGDDIEENSPLGQILARLESSHPAET